MNNQKSKNPNFHEYQGRDCSRISESGIVHEPDFYNRCQGDGNQPSNIRNSTHGRSLQYTKNITT